MVDVLARSWWMFLVRGLAAVLFGALVLGIRGLDVLTLANLFGAYATVYGLLTFGTALARHPDEPWWGALVVGGSLSLLAAAVAFSVPTMGPIGLLMLFAAWAISVGMTQIVAALRLRTVMGHEWLLALSGVLSTVFGVVLSMFPRPGALALSGWIGLYAVVIGLLAVALGIRLRTWGVEHHVLEPRSA